MRRTTPNAETLAHTGSQLGPNIQQGDSRPVGTIVQRESSMSPHAVGETSGHHGCEVGSSVRSHISITPQIDDMAADDDVIMSSAREFEEVIKLLLSNLYVMHSILLVVVAINIS